MNPESQHIISVVLETLGFEKGKQVLTDYQNFMARFTERVGLLGGKITSPTQFGTPFWRETAEGRRKLVTPASFQMITPQGQSMNAYIEMIRDASGKVEILDIKYEKLKETSKNLGDETEKLSKKKEDLIQKFVRLAARAWLVIPIWMTLRLLYREIFKIIEEGLRSFVELDTVMAHLQVTLGNTEAAERALSVFRKLSETFGTKIKDISTAFDVFIKAGFDTQTALEGVSDATKLSIVAMEDTGKSAQTIAGLYSVLQDNVGNAFITEPIERFFKALQTAADIQKDSLEVLMNRMRRLREELFQGFLIGITGANNFKDALKDVCILLDRLVTGVTYYGVAINKLFTGLSGYQWMGRIGEVYKKWLEKTTEETKKTLNPQELLKGWQDFLTSWQRQGPYGRLDMLKSLGYSEEETMKFMTIMDEVILTLDKLRQTGYYEKGGGKLKREEPVGGEVKNLTDVNRIITEINRKREYQLTMTSRLRNLGYDELTIEIEKLKYLDSEEERWRQVLRIQELINNEIIKYSDELKKSINDALIAYQKGEIGFTEVFKRIGDTIRENIQTALTEGFTEQLFKATRMGETFGLFGLNIRRIFSGQGTISGAIEGGFDYGAKITYESIVRGFQVGTGAVIPGVAGAAGWTGGYYGGGGIQGGAGFPAWTLPGFGPGGWWNRPIGAKPEIGLPAYGQKVKGGLTPGQLGGMYAMSALLGYSQYQQAGGGGRGIASGVMTGLGAFGLMAGMAGAFGTAGVAGLGLLAGLGPVGWIAAIGLLLGGLFLGGKAKQTQITTQTTERTISSKIDVTNKSLEIINRNLIALRTDIRTFIMPSSYYFSAKRGVEEEYALMSQRGFMG